MSSVSVTERWWMDHRTATRDVAGGQRMRRPQTRDLRLLSARMAGARGNVDGARKIAERHRAQGNDVQADRWQAESDRQSTIAEALQAAVTWLMRDAADLAAFAALLNKTLSLGSNGPLASVVDHPRRPQAAPPLLAGTATPRAPAFGGASVAA